MKLLIIADDLTGALDTGIQFTKYGANTKIIAASDDEYRITSDNDSEVLVIDAETRHLTAEQAYKRVFKLVENAISAGIAHIYKKTDSGLRGNIGSELKALLDASNEKFLPFIPAYPQMNRVTIEGFHYIDGQPISESVFGKDPFEPVTSSEVKELFDYRNTEIMLLGQGQTFQTEVGTPTIGIFDAQTDDDIKHISSYLNENNQLKVMAGCAGFASFLPELLNLTKKKSEMPRLNRSLLVLCGSLNPISKEQIEYAEKKGFKRVKLTPGQLLEENYPSTPEGELLIASVENAFKDSKVVMLDTGITDLASIKEYITDNQVSLNEVRAGIALSLGRILKHLLDLNQDHVLMIIGGDTLLGFFEQVHCQEIHPVRELEAGNVLSYFYYNNKKQWIISKSGGFGKEDVIYRIAAMLHTEGGTIC